MHAEKTSVSDTIVAHINDLLPALESFYTDVHAYPELSIVHAGDTHGRPGGGAATR
jgi:hypothetical protein